MTSDLLPLKCWFLPKALLRRPTEQNKLVSLVKLSYDRKESLMGLKLQSRNSVEDINDNQWVL